MVTKIYRGKISIKDIGDTSDVLVLNNMDDPLVDIISQDMAEFGHCLSVRYFTCEKDLTVTELEEAQIKYLFGDSTAEFQPNYSDYTGYLWTDMDLTVGGHDLLHELEEYSGYYLTLEINFSKRDLSDKS